ncbi:MAG: nitroreductase family protein [Clostridium sp.]|nr:nitroreductase family protein [Clostridium sp.]
MELNDCIKSRRSIRRYADRAVTKEQLEEIITAANMAPSWANTQVSRYYIANGAAKLEAEKYLPDFNRNNVKNASALIVTTVVNGKSGFDGNGAYSTHLRDGFQYFDNGLQVENLCLKAAEMGLGTLIMGIYDEAGFRSYFNISEEEIIVCVVSVGYPDKIGEMPKRKKTSEIAVFKE